MKSIVVFLALCALAAPVAYALPSGFTKEVVMNVDQVMSMAFIDNTRVLLAKRSGQILLADVSSKPAQTTPYMQLSNVDYSGEKGCMSIILDPDFESNNYIYIYYSDYWKFKISRFTHQNNGGGLSSSASLNSEVILWEDPDGHIGPYHYGGDISFGPDNKIYLSLGDKYYPELATDDKMAAGKIIRINKDGTIPSDNWGMQEAWGQDNKLDSAWATGMRNGFRSRWDLPTNRYFIAEVGGNKQSIAMEDIHLGKPGVDFGWPLCEGPCNNPDYSSTCSCAIHDDPIFAYTHKDSNMPTGLNAAIIGGFVYRGYQFPGSYNGVYFYGDYSRQWIKYLVFDSSGQNVVNNVMFEPYSGQVTGFEPAPDGSFYYATLNQIHHVYYSSGNMPPVISSISVTPQAGAAPLQVSFGGSVFDPDNDPLSYKWFFGDQTSQTGLTASHTYTNAGSYSAYLEVSDFSHVVLSDYVSINVGSPPVATITSPNDGTLFLAGETITIKGEGYSSQDGYLSGSSLKWIMTLVHDDHTHPAANAVGDEFVFDIPTSGHGFSSYVGYHIELTVTDSSGLSDTTYIEIWPTEVDLTFDSQPQGIPVLVDGMPAVTPEVMDTLIGFKHSLTAPETHCLDGVEYTFVEWSNGQPMSHTFTVPDTDETYTAIYQETGTCFSQAPLTSNLVMHLSAGSGVTTSNGAVTKWVDSSANDNDLVVAPSLGGPTLVPQGLNGHNVVSFDGINDGLWSDSIDNLPLGSDSRTVAMAVKYDSAGWGGFTWGSASCNEVFGPGVTASVGNLFIETFCDGETTKSGVAGNGAGWMIQTVVFDGSTNNVKHYKDDQLIEELNIAFNTANMHIRLGHEHSGGAKVDMDVAEVLVYNYAASDDQLQLIWNYLNYKYFDVNNQPEPVTVTFETNPSGFALSVDGEVKVTPFSVVADPGTSLDLVAETLICDDSKTQWVFDSWTSGGSSASSSFSVPESDVTVTATYSAGGSCADNGGGDGGNNGDLPVTDGLSMHLVASQGVSVTGNDVTLWQDQSGNGNDLSPTNPGSAAQPTLVNDALNGHPVVSMLGDGDALGKDSGLSLPSGDAPRTAILMVKYDGPGWGGFTWGETGCGTCWGPGVTAGKGNFFVEDFCSGDQDASNINGADSGWVIQAATYNNGKSQLYIDGQLVQAINRVSNVQANSIRLGVEQNDWADIDMSVAELIVFDRVLSSTEMANVNAYLQAKYMGSGSGETATLTIESQPVSAISVLVNGVAKSTPHSVTALAGTGSVDISVVNGQCIDNVKYTLSGWSDGQGGSSTTRTISFPSADQTLTLFFSTEACDNSSGDDDNLPVVSQLVMHLVGDQGVTLGANSAVTEWADQTGQGHNLVPLSGQPVQIQNALNGHAVISFDGNDDYLGKNSVGELPVNNEDRTVFLVTKYKSAGWGGFTWGSVGCMQTFGPGVTATVGNLFVETFCTADTVQTGLNGMEAGWLIQTITVQNGLIKHYHNSNLLETLNEVLLTDPAGFIHLGAEQSGWAKINMEVAELAVFSRALSDAELGQVHSHLAAKYGIAL